MLMINMYNRRIKYLKKDTE